MSFLHRIKSVVFYTAAVIFLTLSFQWNSFGAASGEFFEIHQNDSEALVIGRLIETRLNGPLSQSGFSGFFPDQEAFTSTSYIDYQYDVFKEGKAPHLPMISYYSNSGLQGFFYAGLDRAFEELGVQSSAERLSILMFSTAFLLSATLLMFVFVVQKHFGFAVAAFTVALIGLSQWIVVFANNLYWVFFLIPLPFVITMYFLQKNAERPRHFYTLYALIAAAIFVKSLMGYEYMSTIFLAMTSPLFFFAIKDNWYINLFLKRFFWIGVVGVAGFCSAVALHIMQLTHKLGSLDEGLKAFTYIVLKRTHGDPAVVGEAFRASLESPMSEVLAKYWYGNAFDLNGVFGINRLLSFGDLILFLAALSVVGCVVTLRQPHARQHAALMVAMWFSILAPISWHVLAKGHSYIHGHMNHVLWYIPFLLWGFVYMGYMFSLPLSFYKRKKYGR